MIRRIFSVLLLVSSASTPSFASQCLDASKVQEFIVKKTVGVLDIYFSHVQHSPSTFVFKLKGGEVFSVSQDGQCVLSAEVMSYKRYTEETNDYGECDGCDE